MADVVEITAPGHFFAQDWYTTLVGKLYEGTDYLAQMEEFNVTDRTPDLTGALRSDIHGVGYHDVGDPTLALIYADDANQEDEYGRFYALYQEGGALGLSTYTNDPHEMFAQIMTTDIPAIQQWGTDALQGGLDALAQGQGLMQ